MRLKVAFLDNPRLQPLLDGSIRPEGIEFEWQLGHPAALFRQHLTENALDVFEFSLSGYLVARDRPNWAHLGWTAIPVFLAKAFLLLDLHVNVNAGIRGWADLAGKRIGLPDYNMTAAIWMRIILKHLYSIQARDITWINGRQPEQRHSTLIGFKEPPAGGIVLRQLEPGVSMNDLLARGEIDAAIGDGQSVLVREGPTVRRLLDATQSRQLLADFARQAGVTPINHALVVKEWALAEHPGMAQTLYHAFEEAKQESYRRARQAAEAYLLFPEADFASQATLFGADPFPSGIAANRRVLEMLVEQLVLEGQLDQPPAIESLFAGTTHAT